MASWVILVGSPYDQGKCSTAATRIADALRELGNHVELFSSARIAVHGCIGCDRCKENFTCIYSDDLVRISSALDTADAVLVVSPIYFAGVPSQFKAVLDRFQPYFWKRQQQIEQGRPLPAKRALYVRSLVKGETRMAPLPRKRRSHLLLLLRIFQWLTRVISSLSMKIRSFLKHCR